MQRSIEASSTFVTSLVPALSESMKAAPKSNFYDGLISNSVAAFHACTKVGGVSLTLAAPSVVIVISDIALIPS